MRPLDDATLAGVSLPQTHMQVVDDNHNTQIQGRDTLIRDDLSSGLKI